MCDQPTPVVPRQARSMLFLKKVHLHLETPNLLIQRRRKRLGIQRVPRHTALEQLWRILQQLPFPLRNLCRMHLVARCQFSQGVHPLCRLQRHFRFELLRMTLPYLTHFLDSFAYIVRLAARRLKPPNLYLATVQKMRVTSGHLNQERG